ncbi:MAG: beta-ketoacyl synthase chain length factor [Taibaiella sp.]|nr:beta-ketoacyl synthase chain length factor [Taibaiella sp.]
MYIHSVCSISRFPVIKTGEPLPELAGTFAPEVQEPNYADYIPPMQSRRMSKGLKMGLTAALNCLQESGVSPEQLKAIEVGTSYGLLKDSETFLDNMIVHQETALTPTAFIQSTHNTVSGAIALSLKSHVHNMTFTQKGHSFESAVKDTELVLAGNEAGCVLLGAVEEKVPVLEWLLTSKATEELPIGEGAAFLLLSNKPDNAICQLTATRIFKTKNPDIASEQLKQIIGRQSGECPIIIWNSLNPGILNYTSKIVDVSGLIGYNPTGAAQALVIGAKTCQQEQCPVLVVNQFKEYWSVFELS